MKYFKFLTDNNNQDIPTPQEIRNSPWLTHMYRLGRNAQLEGLPPVAPEEYHISQRTINTWHMGYTDAQQEN